MEEVAKKHDSPPYGSIPCFIVGLPLAAKSLVDFVSLAARTSSFQPDLAALRH
jgi:hypothetical protein